jgi:NTP pyrophosphatase (non-canonical NTP hydrolase)
MRERRIIGSSKTPFSKQISSVVESALRPKHAPKNWKRPIAVKTLADELGVGYQSLAYYLSARNNIPAFILPDICKTLGDFGALNILEERAGRVSYRVPFFSGGSIAKDDLKAVHKLVKEVAEALEVLSDTLKEDFVEASELERARPELNDVIRECVRLGDWLELRSQEQFKRVPKTASSSTRIRTLKVNRVG